MRLAVLRYMSDVYLICHCPFSFTVPQSCHPGTDPAEMKTTLYLCLVKISARRTHWIHCPPSEISRSQADGTEMKNVLPFPGVLSTQTRPRWTLAM